MLAAAPALAVTTKNDVVSACTINIILLDTLRISPDWESLNRGKPQNLEIDPATGLPKVPDFSMGIRLELTPVLPVLPRRGAFYRLHMAETGGTTSAADTCKAAIASYVLGTGKVGIELDKLLGDLAYELIGKVTAGNGKLVEQALKAIAANVSDDSDRLREFITQKASEAGSGSVTKPKNLITPSNPSGQ